MARSLAALPVTSAAFKAGRLSWTQVRALTRVAGSGDEQTYVALARHATGAQLERLVRGVRRAQKIVEDEADPEQAAHRMRTRVSYDVDGTLVLSVPLPAERGAVLLAALEQARAELDRHPRQSSAEDTARESSAEDSCTTSAESDRPAPATLAEGLLHVARTFLEFTASEQPDLARRHRSRLVAHIDPLSGWTRLHDGELLPPASLPRDVTSAVDHVRRRRPGWRLRALTAGDLTRHDLGRSAREPTLALREHLGTIDGERCRFPGCSRHRRLHAHHVVHWSAGGATDLANLVLVCPRHHTLIHGQHFQLTLRPDRTLTVATADGVQVRHHPVLPWQPAEHLDPGRDILPTTLPPAANDQLHLSYAVGVLMQQAA